MHRCPRQGGGVPPRRGRSPPWLDKGITGPVMRSGANVEMLGGGSPIATRSPLMSLAGGSGLASRLGGSHRAVAKGQRSISHPPSKATAAATDELLLMRGANVGL